MCYQFVYYACLCVYVCLRPRLLITRDVMWHDMDLTRLVKQVLQLLPYGEKLWQGETLANLVNCL